MGMVFCVAFQRIPNPHPPPPLIQECNHEGKEIKNNAWVTMNNDFWVTSEAIYQ